MPFRRRRGKMAGHSELRHKTQATSSGNMDGSRNEDKEIDAEPVPEPPPHSPSKPQPLSVPLTIQTEDASLSLPDRPSDSSASRPDTPLVQQETNKHRRFSLLRFRNASDSQLSLRARQQAERPPPVPKRKHFPFLPLLTAEADSHAPSQARPSPPRRLQTTLPDPGR